MVRLSKDKIKLILLKKHWDWNDLSLALNQTKQAVSFTLSSRYAKSHRFSTIEKYAKVLGVEPADIIEQVDE